MIYDVNGNALTSDQNVLEITLEGGTIGDEGKDSYDIASFGSYSRSALLVRLNGATASSLDMSRMTQTTVTAYFYNASRAYLSKLSVAKDSKGIAKVSTPTSAAFVRFVFSGQADSVVASFGERAEIAFRKAMYSPTERFAYKVYGNICNTGRMILPPNYDPDGKKVPLIVFMHGSGTFNAWTDELPALTIKKYLADEGFAFIDLFGWGSKYAVKYSNNFRGNDPLCIPYHVDIWGKGIDYVCSRYNIDREDVHIVSKSMGGMLALYCALQDPYKVKSIGMFAPVLDYISIRGARNPTHAMWYAVADELGFEGNIEDWRSHYMYDPEGVAYINLNKEAFITLNPAWQCLVGQSLQEKVDASIENCEKYWTDISRTDIYQDTDLAQVAKVPIKIWGAADDAAIPYMKMAETVAQFNNGGCEAHLRTMPSGCGGHFSTDTAYNQYAAVRKEDVTTACGVHYDAVPLAYWENIQWIRLHQV